MLKAQLKINDTEMSEIPTSKKLRLGTEFKEIDGACVNSKKCMFLTNKCLDANTIEENLKVASCPAENLNALCEKASLIQQVMDNSNVLFSSTLSTISDTTKKLKMPNTDSDSAVIKIIEKDEESCSESDLDTQMEDFYKLLNSKSIDSENALNYQKSLEVCKQLVKSVNAKSDTEVCDCNSTNEIMSNNDKPLCISSEIHSHASVPHFTFSTESSFDENDLESEIKAFYDLLKSEPIEVKSTSLNKILHYTDLKLESGKSIKGFTINQTLECQTAISEDKYIVPETGKASESKILESSKSEVTVCDDNSDKINLDPIEKKDKYSNQSLYRSPSSNAEIRECIQLLTPEFSKETKQELEETHGDTNYSSMSCLTSDSDDILSIFCESDVDCDEQEQMQNSKFLKCEEIYVSNLEETEIFVANKNNASLIDNKIFVKSSEMKLDFNSNKCKQVAEPAFQNDKNNTSYHNVSNHIAGDSSTFGEAIENAGNKTLILCRESDLDDNIADATILGLENDIAGDASTSETLPVSECDIAEDASTCDESIPVTECDIAGDASTCDETTPVAEYDIALDASTCEEFVLVSECDGESTLIHCCESDLDHEQNLISEKTNICTCDESTIDNECLVSISENSDIVPLPLNVGNAYSVQVDHVYCIDENDKQETKICTYDGNSSIYNECLALISENLDIIPQPSNACSVKVDHISSINENDKQDTVRCSISKVACTVSKIEESKVLETALLKQTEINCNGKNKKPISLEIDEIFKSPIKRRSDGKESVINKIEQKAEPTRDFYEKEKDDVIDPRWQNVKELSTNKERYQQVKSCWGSSTVPDPDRNLTYHSHRKRQFRKSKIQTNQIRQHKRQASTKLSGNEAKRLRPCTYLFDDKITAIAKEKEEQTMEIIKEMKSKIRKIKVQHHQKKASLQNFLPPHNHMDRYNFHASSFLNLQLTNLQQQHQRQVACVKDEYQRTIHKCDAKYQSGLNSLNNIRNEVLQFYSFYKGASKCTVRDPTLLNDSQLQELDDIENFYSQMDNYYK